MNLEWDELPKSSFILMSRTSIAEGNGHDIPE